MAGADDEIGPEQAFDPKDLFSNFIRRGIDQYILCIDPAKKNDSASIFLGESHSIHSGGPGLYWMETVYTRVDQAVDHPLDRTTGVKQDLVSPSLRLFSKPLDPGK